MNLHESEAEEKTSETIIQKDAEAQREPRTTQTTRRLLPLRPERGRHEVTKGFYVRRAQSLPAVQSFRYARARVQNGKT